MSYCEQGHETGTLYKCPVCKGWYCLEHLRPRQKHNCKVHIKHAPKPTPESLPFI